MKRLVPAMLLIAAMATPSMAISEFGKQWKNEYLGEGADPAFVKAGRKAGCYTCHIKGKDKEEFRNEYGEAVHEFLKSEDFSKEYVKANPEEAKAKIVKGFEEAGKKKSSDGKTFAEKIKAGELPATNAGL